MLVKIKMNKYRNIAKAKAIEQENKKRLLKIKGQGTAYQEVTKSKISVDMYAVDKNAQIAMQNLQEGVQELIGILLDLGISRENITAGILALN